MSALGTEFKMNVHLEPIDGLRMSGYEFECAFYVYTNRGVVYKKGDEYTEGGHNGSDECTRGESLSEAM